MDPDRLEAYFQAITVLEARDRIVDLEIVSYPYIQDQSSRESIFAKYKRLAFPQTNIEKSSPINMEALAEKLKRELANG